MAKMEYMQSYGKGYKPPSGSAGGEAKGQFSSKGNPRSVPKKGSEIGSMSDYGMNADKAKVKGLEKAQAQNEKLRGIGC